MQALGQWSVLCTITAQACYSTRYDFAGNVTGTIESHTSPTGETHRVKTELTLDKRGNVLRERIYADGTLVTDTEYTYDELMRPTGRVTTGSGGSVLTETTTLDIRGWRTAHSASRRGEDLYSQELAYMNPSQGAAPRWTGLISEATTAQLGSSPNTFGYTYDSAGRLTAAGSAKGSENGIRYDANGNMTALRRLPAAGSATADLTMAYSGNRLASVTNSGAEQPGSFSYEYDSNGNMTKDSRKALEFSHNVLNLPMTVSSLAGSTVTNTMTYTYLGDGTRVGARVSNPDAQGYSGMRYRGSFVYDVTADGVHSLQSIAVSTGRLIALTGTNGTISFESDGFITDHLGNVAAVVNLSAPASTSNANVILEQDEYYPFGTRIEPAGRTQATNRYRYAGKEEQDIAGMDLGLLDFGARYYDAFVGRWNAIDPLAHKYFGMSPYNYCGNDPVNKFDPDGNRSLPLMDQYKQWNVKVDSWFGKRDTGLVGASSFHKGLDFNYSGGGNTDLGSPIIATHEGLVEVHDSNSGGSGRSVTIVSPDGKFRTRYFHLQSISVAEGQYVWESDAIGEMGGSAMGKDDRWASHLHYEIQVKTDDGWVSIDPTGNLPNQLSNIEDPQLRIPEEDKSYNGGTLLPAIISN